MTPAEKNAWIQLVVVPATWIAYAVALAVRADGGALSAAPYVDLVLWTIGGGLAVAVTAALLVRGRVREKPDTRDREIEGRANAVGGSLVVIGALTALGLALADVPSFWIANTLYLTFVLAGVLGAMAQIGLYRVGVPQW